MQDALVVHAPTPPALVAELAQLGTQAQGGLETVQAMTVNTPEAFQRATELCRMAKQNHDALDKRRTALTKPLLEVKRGIDDLFRDSLKALEAIEATLKAKMAGYAQEVAAERQRVMAASAAELAAGNVPTAIVPQPAAASGVGMRDVLDFEIVDAKMVPRQYCSPDPSIIREVLAVAGDIVQIPGIRVFKKTSVTVRK